MVFQQAAGAQMGVMYSRLMVAVALLTMIAIVWLPKSHGPEAFRGRTPSSVGLAD